MPMNKANVVIIGGSTAGLTAGITSRRHYPDKNVLIIRLVNAAEMALVNSAGI